MSANQHLDGRQLQIPTARPRNKLLPALPLPPNERSDLKRTQFTNFLLLIIAISLVAMAARDYIKPPAAHAQSGSPYPLYIEPGTQLLRAPDGSKQVLGRVMVDMTTGKVWGFPTTTSDTYPVNSMESKPSVSHPFLLGRFAFEDIGK